MKQNHLNNELAKERSPYLLQHATNPVHWKGWNEETFKKAKNENKIIFLSIGYSTCHWCHVMEKESFENEKIANALNESYISIKVDKEALPAVDKVFMNLAVVLNGSGGWPLTVFLTPDLKPFFFGTYFPPYNAANRKGFFELINEINKQWESKPALLIQYADNLVTKFEQFNPDVNAEKIDVGIFELANQEFLSRFDFNYGGFQSQKNKFPSPQNLEYLLLQYSRLKNDDFLSAVEFTLQSMRVGGIFDQIGYGFHRYSTDEYWLVPHFEKMLYDQATLLSAYAQTYQAHQNPLMKQVCHEIIEYLNREMKSENRGYFSAEDADSEGEEGTFYIFEDAEFKNILSEQEYKYLKEYCDIDQEGNYLDEASQQKIGKNIIHFIDKLKNYEDIFNNKTFQSIRSKLFQYREKRIHPFKDKKIQLDWNALLLSSIAQAARIFNQSQWIDEVILSLEWLESLFFNKKQNQFYHFVIDGNAPEGDETLDDIAFFIHALIEVYMSTYDIKWLKKAYEYQLIMNKNYFDDKNGGFYFNSIENTTIIKRLKDNYDGAYPSGNSIAVKNLIILGKYLDKKEFLDMAEKSILLCQNAIVQYPLGYAKMLINIDILINETFEIIVTGNTQDTEYQSIIEWLKINVNSQHLPIIINEKNHENVSQFITSTEMYKKDFEQVQVYICQNYQCKQPVSNLKKVKEIILK